MTTTTEATPTGPILLRYRRTSLNGQRGVVWEWALLPAEFGAEPEWSEPNGPFPTIAEARTEARLAIAGWPAE